MFRYAKRIDDSVSFMRHYAQRINSLLPFAEGNKEVTNKLVALSETFTFTVAPPECRGVKKCQKEIATLYEKLYATIREDEWIQNDVMSIIKDIEHKVGEINSYR